MVKRAIILAGGRGTRMPDEEKHLPKPLVAVGSKPILAYQIERLRDHGFEDIRISLCHKAYMIVDWLTLNGQHSISYFIEKEALGTGGGIKFASRGITEPFIAFNGDNLADFDFSGLLNEASRSGQSVICGVHIHDASDFGLVEYSDDGRIRAFREKRPESASGTINAGAYAIHPRDFDNMPDSFSIERDLFPSLAESGRLRLLRHGGSYWFDCGTRERLTAARNYFDRIS